MDNLIDQVTALVEDRIAEILESGDLRLELIGYGFPTIEYSTAFRKHKFLAGLSAKLHLFRVGTY